MSPSRVVRLAEAKAHSCMFPDCEVNLDLPRQCSKSGTCLDTLLIRS